jgi:class 3 adenylate cyclase
VETPETQFTRIGDDRIAYQVFGDGPIDLLYAPSTTETVDIRWDWPPYAHFLRRLASFSRVISFDRRGVGASDPISHPGLAGWEEWADDARAVLDAVDSERAVFFAGADTGPIGILFAATEPERASGLILHTTTARFAEDDDYPGGLSLDTIKDAVALIAQIWGTEDMAAFGSPTAAEDPAYRRWFSKMQRSASSAHAAARNMALLQSMDVRQFLPSLRTPTLVIHRKTFHWIPLEQARYLADRIPGARLLVIPGDDANPYSEPVEEALQAIETFVTGAPSNKAVHDRVLAAVLFTDIAGSTERAAAMGDRRWQTLLESHDTITRGVVNQCGGRVVKSTGDGVLASFDGPGRAVRCAISLREALRTLAVEIRAGLHTGEVELHGDDISGIGVHVAARVMEHAGAGEILVSGAVPLLMAGSGVEFEHRGEWVLKGVPGEWPLFMIKA